MNTLDFSFWHVHYRNALVWLTGNHKAQLSYNCSNQTRAGNNNYRQEKLVIKRSVCCISNDRVVFSSHLSVRLLCFSFCFCRGWLSEMASMAQFS